MPESVFCPTSTKEIRQVACKAILDSWSVPAIDGVVDQDTFSSFVVSSFGSTFTVTIRKEQ